MALTQASAFLCEISSTQELQQRLNDEGADLIQVAADAGFALEANDLESLNKIGTLVSKGSNELKNFLELAAKDPELQHSLSQPGCDPIALASCHGINLDKNELETLTTAISGDAVAELSDEELGQVTGGAIIEALLLPVTVSLQVAAGMVIIGGALAAAGAIAGIGYLAYKASK